jgi:hypothetical protein
MLTEKFPNGSVLGETYFETTGGGACFGNHHLKAMTQIKAGECPNLKTIAEWIHRSSKTI